MFGINCVFFLKTLISFLTFNPIYTLIGKKLQFRSTKSYGW